MAWATGHKLQGGKYTIEKELGKGGFGITYLARNANGQPVVIKTLNDTVQNRRDFNEFQQDFLNEAVRLAKCTHPNIVKIIEVVQETIPPSGSLWCMVMEYIDGEDLASRVDKKGILPEAEALQYIQQIGEALTVVHNQGLLHRDVKPHNIMLRLKKGGLEAILIDFGIAREFTPHLTQTHTQYMTEYFAPIEQYDRRAQRGAYTDVYALAATLYTILTGQLPETSPLRAVGTPLTPPKQHNSSISDKVNRAILKGMAVKGKDRPQSMAEWLKLLGLSGSVTVGNPSPPQQRVDYIVLAGMIASVGMVLSILIALSRQPAPQVENLPTVSVTPTNIDESPTPQSPSPTPTETIASPIPQSPSPTPIETIASPVPLNTDESPTPQSTSPTPTETITPPVPLNENDPPTPSVVVSPSPTASSEKFTPVTTFLGHTLPVYSVAFSPDGQTLASSSKDSTIKLWDIRNGQLKTTLTGHSFDITSVAFSPNGQTLASGSSDRTIKLWDVHSGKLKSTLTKHSGSVKSVAFSPDGQTLASGGEAIKLWDVRTGKLKNTLTGHSGLSDFVAFSPDGHTLVSGGSNYTIKLWDVRNGELTNSLTGHFNTVYSVAFSPDGKTLASGAFDSSIRLWDVRSGKLKTTLRDNKSGFCSVAFSPNGETLASGGSDRTIKLWDVRSGELKTTLKGHSDHICSVTFSPDGQTLASGSRDNTIKIWRLSP